MIKLLLLIFAAGGAVFWLKRSAANRRVKRYSNKLSAFADGAHDFDELSAGFDTLIKQFQSAGMPGEKRFETGVVQGSLTQKFKDRYIVRSVTQSLSDKNYLVVADAKVKEFIPNRGGGRYIDRFYPASMLLKAGDGQLAFYGPFPEDKHHQMIQQDLAGHLFDLLTKDVAAANKP